MSDQNPYGQPRPADNPYGQPASPEGAPQPSWSQPSPYAAPPAGGPDTGSRPGTVTAAAWIAIVLSGISLMLWGLSAVMFLAAGDRVIDEMQAQPEFDEINLDVESLSGIIVATMVVLAVWSLGAVVLGVLVMRRSNVARILLVISSGAVALLALVLILSGFSALWLIAAVGVIVLLFVGGANDWFARRAPRVP